MIKSTIHFLFGEKYRSLISAVFMMFLAGTIAFHFLEGWKWFDSFYFCVMTLATVGFGDFTPKTDLGKLFVIIYVISGIGIFLTFIQTYFDFLKERHRDKKNTKK